MPEERGGEINEEWKDFQRWRPRRMRIWEVTATEASKKKSVGADGVVEWLRWPMDGVDEIEEAKAGLLVEEQELQDEG